MGSDVGYCIKELIGKEKDPPKIIELAIIFGGSFSFSGRSFMQYPASDTIQNKDFIGLN